MEDETTRAIAEAAKEVAKPVDNAITGVREFGGFIGAFVKGPAEQVVGLIEDRLKYARWERKVRLMQRAKQLMEGLGSSFEARPLELKIAVPMLEGAALEDDPSLQEKWANLLVNMANGRGGIAPLPAFSEILRQLSPLEATLLDKIYSLPEEVAQTSGVLTAGLPDRVEASNHPFSGGVPGPSEDVEIALTNLYRLGCIVLVPTAGGGPYYGAVLQSLLGRRFVAACREPVARE